MKDEDKKKGQLIDELAELRQRIAELEASETERKRVEEALRRSLQEAETLRQANVVISSTLDLEEALNRILEQLHRVVAYDSASVELLRDDHLEIVGRRGFADPLVHIGFRFPVLGDNPHTCVIESGEPVILADTQAAQAPFRELPHEHFRSWLGVPMRFRERIIGVIALDSREPDHFSAEHARLAVTFANQAAIAIENARLYQNERKRAAQLAVVNQVGQRAASILDMDQLLQEAVTAIQEGFNYHSVALFLLDEAAGELEVLAIAGGFEDLVQPGYRQALGEGMTGWTAKTGQSLLANDVSQEPRYIPGFLEEPLTNSELCVPLKLTGKVIGVLDIESSQLNAFDETDLTAMETLADQIAVAIENAQLYQETVRRLEETETLGAVTTTLTRSLDLDQVLQSIMDSATQLIPTGTGGVIHLVDKATGKLIPRATLAPEVNIEEKLEMPIGEGIAGLAVQERRLINVPNVEKEPRFLTVDAASPKKSLLTAPLLIDGDCIGTLSLNSDQVDAFGANAEWLLRTLAAQAAVAVKNARLFEQAQREIAERKRAEEALRESKERFRRLSEAALEGIAIHDEGTILDANQTATAMFGYELSEVIGMDPLDFVTPESRDLVLKNILSGYEEPYEAIGLRKDGSTFMGEFRGKAIPHQGRMARVVIVRDITERKRAEEALLESEERFRLAFEDGPIGMVIVGLDYRLLKVNRAFCEMLGYTEQELAALTFVDITHPEDVEKDLQLAEQVFKGEIPSYKLEKRYITKSQEILWIDLTATVIRDQDGKTFYGLAMLENITERKRVEEELRESEERFRTIVEAAPSFLMIADEKGNNVYASPNCEEITGYTQKELLGRVEWWVHEDDTPRAKKVFDGTFREGVGGKGFEYKAVKKNGEVWYASSSWEPLKDKEGTFQGVVLQTIDITERKRAEEALRQRTAQLEALREVGLELTAQLDLDTLLRSIASRAVELLEGSSGGLYLYQPEREVLEWAVSIGPNLAPVGSVLHRGEGLSGKVWETGEPLIVDAYQQWEERATIYEDYSWTAVLGVPVRWGEDFLGVLDVLTDAPRTFSPQDAELLSLFATQAAIALKNAQLYESVSQQGEQLRALAVRLAEAEEAERQQIARELHDQVGQNLTALGINLNIVRSQIPEEAPDLVRSRLDDSLALVEETTDRVRSVMAELRPPVLDDYGLVAALRWYGGQFASRMDIAVEVQGEEPDPRLPARVESALFRIAQEALTNVAKHAQATQTTVTVEVEEETVRMVVADDGVGFSTEPDERRGWGLLTMSERAEAVGGRCHVESRPERGTGVTVEMPR